MIALEAKQRETAIGELAQSTPNDPRLFYLTALVYQGRRRED